MSSSSSTIPVRSEGRADTAAPARSRLVIAWILLVVWALLIGFGLVSLTNPTWLDKIAASGAAAEAYAYKHYGDVELKNGNLPKAVAQYQRSLEIYPEQPEAQANLGIALVRGGNLRQGQEALLKARTLGASQGLERSICFYLGEVAEREKRFDDAIDSYMQALRNGARADNVYQKVGAILLARQEYSGALEAFTKVLASQTDPALPFREMVRQIEEATAEDLEARRWLAAQPSVELREEDWRRYDRETIDRMHATNPEIAKTHNHLGLIHYRMGDVAMAIEQFERSLAIWPGNTDAVRNLTILRSQPR